MGKTLKILLGVWRFLDVVIGFAAGPIVVLSMQILDRVPLPYLATACIAASALGWWVWDRLKVELVRIIFWQFPAYICRYWFDKGGASVEIDQEIPPECQFVITATINQGARIVKAYIKKGSPYLVLDTTYTFDDDRKARWKKISEQGRRRIENEIALEVSRRKVNCRFIHTPDDSLVIPVGVHVQVSSLNRFSFESALDDLESGMNMILSRLNLSSLWGSVEALIEQSDPHSSDEPQHNDPQGNSGE